MILIMIMRMIMIMGKIIMPCTDLLKRHYDLKKKNKLAPSPRVHVYYSS
jgi:hypothetical protein